MTVTDFFKTLIIDPNIKVSIQTKDADKMIELYNSEKLFNHSSEAGLDKEIQYIKIERKSIFIVV